MEKELKNKFTLGQTRLTFRKRIIFIILGLVIGTSSLLLTNNMAARLRVKEQYEISMWKSAVESMWLFDSFDPALQRMLKGTGTIPFIIVDEDLKVRMSDLVPDVIIHHPDLLRKRIDAFARKNREIQVMTLDGSVFYIFYGESALLKMLTWFPLVQLLVIIVFIGFAYMAFLSSKQDEQNRVWIGLAKETAHQLGTPTSSLLGWIEYLRSQEVDQAAVEEMGKDLTRLTKVIDRFSKIGSGTDLAPVNVNEIVGNSVLYFRSRVPRNVTIDYNGLAMAPVEAMVNAALFEWVVENLLKNALDALQGTGKINVKISSDEDWVYVDVSDTGKGIPKSNFKRIFEPGFTTKTRGWGLGLSLSKRIIDSYHKGRIGVLESEPGKGATIRISLKRLYS